MRRLDLVLTLAGKDWRLFWADRRGAALSFLVPIVLASAFGLLFDRPVSKDIAVTLPLLIVADSDDSFTHAVLADLLASPRLEATRVTREEAERRISDRRPGVAVILPGDLGALVAWKPASAAPRPTLEILHNPLCATEAPWAVGIVTEIVMKRVAKQAFGPLAESIAEPPFAVHASAVRGQSQAAFNAYSHSFSGMTLQYLLFWGMESGLLLLRDRNRGVWLRVRAAPVPLAAILVGKALATATIAFVQILVTFGFGAVVFGVGIAGSMTGFLLLAVAVSLLAAATGLLVAAMGGTEARARSVCILAILGVSMIGGLWLPAFLLPGWAREVALSLPTTWAMRGLDGVTWQGTGLIATLPSIVAVVAFTAVFFGVAFARLAAHDSRRRKGFAQ